MLTPNSAPRPSQAEMSDRGMPTTLFSRHSKARAVGCAPTRMASVPPEHSRAHVHAFVLRCFARSGAVEPLCAILLSSVVLSDKTSQQTTCGVLAIVLVGLRVCVGASLVKLATESLERSSQHKIRAIADGMLDTSSSQIYSCQILLLLTLVPIDAELLQVRMMPIFAPAPLLLWVLYASSLTLPWPMLVSVLAVVLCATRWVTNKRAHGHHNRLICGTRGVHDAAALLVHHQQQGTQQ